MKDTGAQPKRRTQMEIFIGRTQSLQVTWTSEMKHKSEKPQLWLYPLCYTNLSAIRVIVLFQHSLRLFKPILERTFAVPPPHKIILPRENWCFLWAVVRADCMQPGDSAKGASLEPPHHPMRGTATWAPCLRNFQSLFHYAVLLGGSEFAFFQTKGLVLFKTTAGKCSRYEAVGQDWSSVWVFVWTNCSSSMFLVIFKFCSGATPV